MALVNTRPLTFMIGGEEGGAESLLFYAGVDSFVLHN